MLYSIFQGGITIVISVSFQKNSAASPLNPVIFRYNIIRLWKDGRRRQQKSRSERSGAFYFLRTHVRRNRRRLFPGFRH